MKKIVGLLLIVALSFGMVGNVFADPIPDELANKEVKLTKEQKQELEGMYKELFAQHKKIIEKYIEFGVISEERGQKMIKGLEKHHERLKENGYLYKKHPKHKHHMKKETDSE